MKNAIMYYYNMHVEDIHLINNNYRFILGDKVYLLYNSDEQLLNIEEIYKLNQKLLSAGVYNHIILLNNDGKVITNIDGKNYILFNMYDDMANDLSLEQIINFNNITTNIIKSKKVEWKSKWIEKIDYIEYQMSEIKHKFPILKNTINYYIGLSETAISLLDYVSDANMCVVHKRIKMTYKTFDLYNPLDFIFDSRVRDTSEYFKYKFFYRKDFNFDEIINYFENEHLDDNEKKLFFIRMLYPSYYFDLYELIIKGNVEESEMLKITTLSNDFEFNLRKLNNYLHNANNNLNFSGFDIEWLKKI